MMRPRLLNHRGEGRHSPRHRRRRGAAPAETATVVESVAPAAAALAPTAEPIQIEHAGYADRDVQRVQEAGGPVDHASYSCACGYLFSADVSTSVTCPHCGTGQAW